MKSVRSLVDLYLGMMVLIVLDMFVWRELSGPSWQLKQEMYKRRRAREGLLIG